VFWWRKKRSEKRSDRTQLYIGCGGDEVLVIIKSDSRVFFFANPIRRRRRRRQILLRGPPGARLPSIAREGRVD